MSGIRIVCPYCGHGREPDDEEVAEGGHLGVCASCGRAFVYEADQLCTVVSHRYEGRTKVFPVDARWPVRCTICSSWLTPGRGHAMCPVCGSIVCDRCGRAHRACCREYEQWAEEIKEEA